MKTPYIIRYGNIYIQTTFKGKMYRFGTGLKATKENLSFVSKNFLEIIFDYETNKGKSTFAHSLETQTAPKTDDKPFAFYLEQVLKESSHSKETTLRTYRYKAKSIFEFFKKIPLSQITREEINSFYDFLLERGGQSTIKAKIGLLKHTLDLAVLDGVLASNPVFNKRGLSTLTKRYKEPFTPKEVEKILTKNLNHPKAFTNYLQVAFFSGMREGEILALKFSNIDFETEKISVEKTI